MMSTLDDDHMIQFMNFRKHVSISGTVSNDLLWPVSTKRYFEKEKKLCADLYNMIELIRPITQ